MKLEDKKWKFFKVENFFTFHNSTPYHRKDLIFLQNGIPYISRTNKNNGVEGLVEKSNNFNINYENTIVFGAENATFFFQPFKYITGNKMYVISNKNFNLYNGLFVTTSLNKSVENCGFGYGQGLTATREQKRFLALPMNRNNKPDYQFMQQYIKSILMNKKQKYNQYISKIINKLEYKDIEQLEEKQWNDFFIDDIFDTIQRGKRLTKSNQIKGNIPYVSSTALSNGVDNFISNDIKKIRIFENCLTVANSGSVGASFYHNYKFIASDHVTHLKKDDMSEYVYLFISTLTNRFKQKYNFNREINDKRVSREKIMLPVDENKKPDFKYMEQYIKNLKYRKIKKYLSFKEVKNG